MPISTEEDEENMEAERRFLVSQRECAGSMATMNSSYSYNGTRSRLGILSSTVGGMPPPLVVAKTSKYRDGDKDRLSAARLRKKEKGKKAKDAQEGRFSYPIPTIEEATADGYGRPDDWDDVIAGYESGSTGVGSEDMAGDAAEEFGFKAKENAEEQAVFKNSAATRPDFFRRMSSSSISLLRSYAQSRGYSAKSTNNTFHAPTTVTPAPSVRISVLVSASSTEATIPASENQANASLIAKQIAPWVTLMKGLSSVKEKPAHISSPSSSLRTKNATTTAAASLIPTPPSAGMGIFRPSHKRKMMPMAEPELEVVLQPLRTAQSRMVVDELLHPQVPSSLTFGSKSSGSGSGTRVCDVSQAVPVPVLQKRARKLRARTVRAGRAKAFGAATAARSQATFPTHTPSPITRSFPGLPRTPRTKSKGKSSQHTNTNIMNRNTQSRVGVVDEDVHSQDTKSHFDMFSTPASASASRIVGKRKLASSTSSRTSDTSEGELNTSFRYSGLPPSEPPLSSSSSSKTKPKDTAKPEDDPALESIYAKIVAEQPPSVHPCVTLDSSEDVQLGMHRRASALGLEMMQQKRESIYKAASYSTSGISFEGFSSFEEVRRGIEFRDERPWLYPPASFLMLVFRLKIRRLFFLFLSSSSPGDNRRLNRPRPRGRPAAGDRTPVASNRSPVPASLNWPTGICKSFSNHSIPVLTPVSIFSPGPRHSLYACTTVPLEICCYSHLL
ncbi:hypothetical protein CVT25_013625 [Psilocybe cyanescens]|uniref:Uncharacterized protein n=1 Tax=Psilocybe cyanescens TaxID=93625 RepID=A0A409WTA0_PSICY|nr:hypothetical protein CVT25_013625 [Psilocybe cyanescens]